MKLSEYFEKWPGIKIASGCKEVQEKAFRLGCVWFNDNSTDYCEEANYLYIDEKKALSQQPSGQIEYFLEKPYYELTLTEFMSIEEEPEKIICDGTINLLNGEVLQVDKCSEGHKTIYYAEGSDCPICIKHPEPEFKEQPQEKDYGEDVIYKKYEMTAGAPIIKDILKRIDEKTQYGVSEFHLTNKINELENKIDASEKRCMEYTDKLSKDVENVLGSL